MRKGLIAMLLAFASFSAIAQRPDNNISAEKRAENQTKIMTDSLKLSADQQKQIYTLHLGRAKQMEEMRSSANADRSKMRESMEAFNTELSKVLTPEQQEKYKAMMEARRNNRGGGARN
ncbi:hypothetical protein [Dyadobacter sp. NIV53]|uniref:hypothetical protein n=1 Tax=Dyadobacter sp. NIV53 TaxID=2861765 RepID=UPI001C874908|nr:hypothetical protein [Dyadobacter sp. NIV53]